MRTRRFALSVLGAALLVAGCGRKAKVPIASVPPPRTAPARPAPTPGLPPPAAVPAGVLPDLPPADAGPAVRIGLTTAARSGRIAGTGELYLVEKSPEATRQKLAGEYSVEVERGASDAGEIYRVQVAAFASAKRAAEVARALGEKLQVTVVTRQAQESAITHVRAGEFTTRAEAERFAAGPVAEAGHKGAIVVRESVARAEGEPRLALRGPGSFFRSSRAGYLIFPVSAGDYVRFDGKPYRGVLDLSLNALGRMTVVNELGAEDYLCGVVPAEISPVAYPEAAALAAQAIAARTYALRNVGRFRGEGFDLTNDDRTQVYGGIAIEKLATTQAVRDTRGLALYYQGALIEAMYASTCGGRTEDFSNVFDRPAVPYLTSVVCAVESASGEPPPLRLRGTRALGEAVPASDGTIANRDLALAEVLGISSVDRAPGALPDAQPSRAELRRWVARARALAVGGPETPTATPPADATSRAGFLRYGAEALFGAAEIVRRVTTADVAYYLANLKDGAEVPAESKPAVAFLMQRALWSPEPDNFARPRAPLRRVDALVWLARWVEGARGEALRSGVLQSLEGTSLVVRSGSRTQAIPLDAQARLFRVDGGRRIAVDELRVIGNERVKFHVGAAGKIDFLEVELSPAGASSDRFSPQATWQTTIARRTVSEKLRALAPAIGEVVDLAPSRLGSSGRAVQIRIEGTREAALLNGYRVRQALGLKDTLFTIHRTRGADGSIESFIFDGRGWGHGIGLCQTGAVGMARAGKTFEEILKAYYRGVELRKAY